MRFIAVVCKMNMQHSKDMNEARKPKLLKHCILTWYSDENQYKPVLILQINC